MSLTTTGVVKNGVIVPNTTLPEGAHVAIHLTDGSPEVPSDLQEVLAAWQRASASSLALVERLAQESVENEKR